VSRHYLITGGAGFIGSHLAEFLCRRGHQITVLDDLSCGSFANLTSLWRHQSFRFIEGSVHDRPLVENLVSNADRVVHLAATVGVMQVFERPHEAFRSNVLGTATVLSAAAAARTRILLASSSEVYGPAGPGHDGSGLCETQRTDPERLQGRRWFYARSKLMNEENALGLFRERNVPVVITRLFNTIGPRQSGAVGMVVPRFVERALKGDPIEIFGDGTQTRCFAWVGDVVRCLSGLIECPAATGRIVNVGSQEEVSIGELARRITVLTGSGVPKRSVPYEEAYGPGFEDTPQRRPNTSRLQRLLGHTPDTPLEEALRRIIRAAQDRSAEKKPVRSFSAAQ